jgi:hypothetical protein
MVQSVAPLQGATNMTEFRKNLVALSLCACALIAGSTAGAQPAKQGEDNVTHIYTYVDKVMKLGDRTVIFRELSGVSTNDKGSGMLHNLGMRCWGFIDVVENKPSTTGRCVQMDAQGDQVFSTYVNKAGVGSATFIGGTGKFAGISGEQTFTGYTSLKGPDSLNVLILSTHTTWKLP